MRRFLLFFIFLFPVATYAQTGMLSTNPVAEQAMLGNYDPANYMASTILNLPDTISKGINARVSADSLKYFINMLGSFQNRNTSSDTISGTKGIGAARKWVYSKFQQFSARNENRLIPSYLQFDQTICYTTRHKNIFAVLPGMDTSDKSIIIIEGHIDSRCKDVCDTSCTAKGSDDNASGTALVMELARVMSKYSYNHTIVFLITIGEEQGLYGAWAFANYAGLKGIKIKAVLNNDITGGIICGHTASAPGCPGFGNIDSTHVRLFSFGGFNSFHKGLARYVKLEYKEMIQWYATVPMSIDIMTPEDRTGRGGDHGPFRFDNFTAIRMTSANEWGDANTTDTSYIDHQHTSADSIGIDTNMDGMIDNYWVDFNYLARNTVINGNAMGMAAISPKTPDFTFTGIPPDKHVITITKEIQYLNYRVGIRSTTYDWDSVYAFTGTTTDTILLPVSNYIISVASVDSLGVESLFSKEITVKLNVNAISAPKPSIELLQNSPNPSDEATMISVLVRGQLDYNDAIIVITDITGKEVKRIPLVLKEGMNEVLYDHGYNMSGIYVYSLLINNKQVASKRMVFNK